ncbi:MAG TPA: ROK family protein [Anaerolineales bacterium]|nr:ROK family protein [Anaerolineales bacterium]
MRPAVAVDLGGTNLRAAFYPTGDIPATARESRKTPSEAGPTAVLDEIHAAISALDIASQYRAHMAIGIGAPGPLDASTGVVLHAPNLQGWNDVPLGPALAERWGCPVYVQNDANLAALGEWRFGAGRGAHHLIMLTIGTGIGGGVIVDDQLLSGSRGLAGEIGHIPVMIGGPRCSCGQSGHLEAIASGTAIAEQVRRRGGLPGGDPGQEPTTEAIAHAARRGDPVASEVLQAASVALGTALAGLVHVFNPERIVLGGGVSQAGAFFLDQIERTLRASLMHPAFGGDLKVVPTALGDEAALLGAVALVQAMS